MGEGAYFKIRDQIIGMTGLAGTEDTRFLEGPGACCSGKNLKFEILKLLEMH